MKLNLTELLMLLGIIGISLTAANQCSQKRKVSKARDGLEALVVEQKKELIKSSAEITKTLSLNDTLTTKLKELETSNKAIEKAYNKSKTELSSITSDSLYKRLKGARELEGELYNIDSTILFETEMDRLALRECSEINQNLESEVELLQQAADAYMNSAIELSGRWLDCESNMADMEGELLNKDQEVKKFKGKMWNNRGLAGVAAIALIVIIAL